MEWTGTACTPTADRNVRVIPHARIIADDDGRITAVERLKSSPPADTPWLLPGFIDAHVHLPQFGCEGFDGLPLLSWLKQLIYPAETRMQDASYAADQAEGFFAALADCGTTTAAVWVTVHASAVRAALRSADRRGMRAIIGMVFMDEHCPPELKQDARQALDQAEALLSEWHGHPRLEVSVNPRFALSCSPVLLAALGDLARRQNAWVQTHLSETQAECRRARELFPNADDYLDIYQAAGLVGPRSLLAHGVWLSDDERRRLTQSKAILVHCPSANTFLSSGWMDYRQARAQGVRLALGSDVAGGPDLFMPRVARAMIETAKAIDLQTSSPRPPLTAVEAFWQMTLGNAEALGLGEQIGSLEVGKQADLLVVRPPTRFAEWPESQQVARLLYGLRRQDVHCMFIQGRQVTDEV